MAGFNWGDLKQAADDAGFSVIPASTYVTTVKTAEAKKTGTGKDKISVRFLIVGGPHDGKSVFNDFVISPDNGTALGFFFRHMKALGLGPEYFATNPDISAVAASLVGKTCQVEVGIRIWNEEERNEINKILPAAPGTAVAPGPSTGNGPSMAKGPQPQPMAQPAPQPQPTAAPAPQPAPAPAPAPQPAPAPAPEPVAQPVEVRDTTSKVEATSEDAAPTEDGPGNLPPKMPF